MSKAFFKNVMRLVACGIALWLTTLIFRDSTFGTFYNLAAAAAVLWLANFLLRPILKILTIPIGCLTLGLSGLLINVLMVWLAVSLIPGINFVGFFPYLVAAILTSLTTSLLVSK
jgi:putative membrane protein